MCVLRVCDSVCAPRGFCVCVCSFIYLSSLSDTSQLGRGDDTGAALDWGISASLLLAFLIPQFWTRFKASLAKYEHFHSGLSAVLLLFFGKSLLWLLCDDTTVQYKINRQAFAVATSLTASLKYVRICGLDQSFPIIIQLLTVISLIFIFFICTYSQMEKTT